MFPNTNELKPYLDACRAAVFNLDGTLVDGRVAEGVGKRFLATEGRAKHYHHVAWGLVNYPIVLAITSMRNETDGLRHFVDVIGKTGCMTNSLFFELARDYIDRHVYPGARELVEYLAQAGKPCFISTIGADASAEAARSSFDNNFMPSYVANSLRARGRYKSVITGIDTPVKTSDDKLTHTERLLNQHGLSLGDCAVFEDSATGLEMMSRAKLGLAAPDATQEVLKSPHTDFHIQDYARFLEELRA